MGNFSSSRQSVYINTLVNPKVQDAQKTISLTGTILPGEKQLIFDCENPFKKLVPQNDDHCKIVITGLYLLYVKNQTAQDLHIHIDKLFHVENLNQDVNHVDDCGSLKILCPANYDNTVNGVDGILYKPRPSYDILKNFSGVIVPDSQIFEKNHPIVYFINNYMPVPETGVKHENHYEFKKEYIDLVRKHFNNLNIRETRFDDTRVSCEITQIENNRRKVPQTVMIIIQINYLLIMPGGELMKPLTMKI